MFILFLAQVFICRLNAKTLKQLQSRPNISPKNLQDKGKTTASRRLGVFSDRQDIDATIGAMEELLGLNGNGADTESGEKLLAAQINAVAVLDMIKNLQEEIEVSCVQMISDELLKPVV